MSKNPSVSKHEISHAELANALSAAIQRQYLPVWDTQTKLLASSLAVNPQIPSFCHDVFTDMSDLQDFMVLRMRYFFFILVEVLGPQGPLGPAEPSQALLKSCSDYNTALPTSAAMLLKFESTVEPGSASQWSQALAQLLGVLSSGGSVSDAVHKVVALRSPEVPVPSAAIVAAFGDASGNGMGDARDSGDSSPRDDAVVSFIGVTQLNSYVGTSLMSGDAAKKVIDDGTLPTLTLSIEMFSLPLVRR